MGSMPGRVGLDKGPFRLYRKGMGRFFLAGLLLAAASLPLRAEDDAQAQTILNNMLTAEMAKDFNAFLADADDHLRAALSPEQFEVSANSVGTRLNGGYDLTFLGELNQTGYEVYLYRIRYKDGTDDTLVTLGMKEGKVAGILFH